MRFLKSTFTFEIKNETAAAIFHQKSFACFFLLSFHGLPYIYEYSLYHCAALLQGFPPSLVSATTAALRIYRAIMSSSSSSSVEILSSTKVSRLGGMLHRCKHASTSTHTDMIFAIFLPSIHQQEKDQDATTAAAATTIPAICKFVLVACLAGWFVSSFYIFYFERSRVVSSLTFFTALTFSARLALWFDVYR
jgi:hypothetical protein